MIHEVYESMCQHIIIMSVKVHAEMQIRTSKGNVQFGLNGVNKVCIVTSNKKHKYKMLFVELFTILCMPFYTSALLSDLKRAGTDVDDANAPYSLF